jgi:hypothetical protein
VANRPSAEIISARVLESSIDNGAAISFAEIPGTHLRRSPTEINRCRWIWPLRRRYNASRFLSLPATTVYAGKCSCSKIPDEASALDGCQFVQKQGG